MNEFTHRCHSQKNQFTILLIGYLVVISQCWFFLISGINHVKHPSDIIWFLATLFWFIVIFPATGAINIWGIIFTVNTVKFNTYINKNWIYFFIYFVWYIRYTSITSYKFNTNIRRICRKRLAASPLQKANYRPYHKGMNGNSLGKKMELEEISHNAGRQSDSSSLLS